MIQKSCKKWIITLVLAIIAFFAFIGVLNYFTDPYGLKSLHGKTYAGLMAEHKYLYPLKISMRTSYYIIGTSRTRYIDQLKLEKYLNESILRVGLSSQTIEETLFLAQKAKHQNANFISGLDVFGINIGYGENRLNEVFSESHISNLIKLLFGGKTFLASIENLTTKAMNLNLNSEFDEMDSNRFDRNSFDDLKRIELDKNRHKYLQYSTNLNCILQLAKLADKRDIFIIFPKYFYYYKIFGELDVQKEYFKAIELLVKNTKAKVYSFYGVNDITINVDNFDVYAWHFKPKIGNLIMARIFGDSEFLEKYEKENNVDLSNFGVELNSENIDEYLESVKYDFEKYKPYLEKALDEPQNAHINKDKFLNQTKSF